MKRYFKFVMIWLAFGLALALVVLTLGSSKLGIADAVRLRDMATLSAVALPFFALIMGVVSLAAYDTRVHHKGVDWFTRMLSGLLLIVILGCFLKIGFMIVPQYSELGLAIQLDSLLGAAWAAASRLTALVRLRPDILGAPTEPIVLGIILIGGRSAVNWGVAALAPAPEDHVDFAPRAGRETDPEAERRRQAATRKVAVASYTEAKALLTTTEIPLTFLSLDVVGSTKMKQGEDPYVIEQTFTDYRRLVERALKHHGAYKQTWTPDGQMAAFQTPQSAVNCAKQILKDLTDFNRTVSKMKTEFQVRLGANSGVVSTDDATPMEQISDFSIDVAGHMQKYAEPDSLWLSEEVYKQLTDTTGIEPNGQEVDHRKVFVWKRPD